MAIQYVEKIAMYASTGKQLVDLCHVSTTIVVDVS